MALSIAIAESRRGLCLSGHLNGSAACMVSSDLLRQLNLPLPCEFDLSGIDGIDDDGLDLLLALKDDGLVERFTRHSGVVLEALGRRRG
jgi:hypothetical protein